MSRWKKKDANKKALYLRKWIKTEAGIAYAKKSAEYAREWRKKNPELKKAIQQRSYDKIRHECFLHYGHGKIECRCCKEIEMKFLHLDHVNGDGAEKRHEWEKIHKTAFGGTGFYYFLKKQGFPNLGLQILCANCNLGKRVGKYCPHELRKGIDMDGNKISEEYLPKPFPKVTRRLRGEAIKEAKELGISVDTLRMRRWSAKQKLLHPKVPRIIPTHCKNGHAYAEGNEYVFIDSRGLKHRQCRQCKRDYKKRVKSSIIKL